MLNQADNRRIDAIILYWSDLFHNLGIRIKIKLI